MKRNCYILKGVGTITEKIDKLLDKALSSDSEVVNQKKRTEIQELWAIRKDMAAYETSESDMKKSVKEDRRRFISVQALRAIEIGAPLVVYAALFFVGLRFEETGVNSSVTMRNLLSGRKLH